MMNGKSGDLRCWKKPPQGTLHSHQPAIRDQAGSTKIRLLYECSVKANSQAPSLNNCLEVRPPLQPIFDILLRRKSSEVIMYNKRHSKGLPPD